MIKSLSYAGTGTLLWHAHVGTALVAFLGSTLTNAIIGAVLGAFIGFEFGNAWGALLGAMIGAITVAFFTYVGTITLLDEDGVFWFWIAQSYFTQSIPWYVWLCGTTAAAAYSMNNLHYLRIGDGTIWNTISLAGP